MPRAPTAAGFGAALILAGLGFGSPSLLVPGVGLLGLATVAVAWVGLARPRLIRLPGPSRVVEDEPFPLRLRAVGSRLPLPGGELTDSVLEDPIRVGPMWNRRFEAEVSLRGRGRRRLAPARLEIRDPLDLRVRVVESDDPGELLVLPQIGPVYASGRGAGGSRSSALTGLEQGAASSQLDARAIELEVDGLRAYREGSPASRIHWPAVARTGELIERRLVAGADAAPLVILDSTRPASSDALDAAVRAAGSLCVHLAAKGGCTAMLPGERRVTEIEPDMRAWPQLHARLALVEPGGPAPAISPALRAGAVFWVTARSRGAIPAALRSGTGGARYLVGPALAGHGAAAFMVCGCEGRRVGARADRALGRAA